MEFTQFNRMDGHILIHMNSITVEIYIIILNLVNKMMKLVFKYVKIK
jgi:hypothetical protein